MQISSRLLALAAFAVCAAAVQTKIWSLNSWEDFEKSETKGIALRSDGRLTLAPAVRELTDAATPHLWAMAQHQGVLYAAGGGHGGSMVRISRLDAAGNGGVFAELEGLEIHALAVDARGLVYAAVTPDGKIYRVGADGKAASFYDTKTKYVWAMAFDPGGALLVATGDPGEVHRVTADGKGEVIHRLDDTHARSLAMAADGSVIIGTEPSGLIVRLGRQGGAFILHQSAKREVTAVAIGRSGKIFAAAVGSKTLPPAPPPPPPAATAAPGAPGAQRPGTPVPVVSTYSGIAASGGSDLIEIDAEGVPRVIWSHPQDIVYAIAIDENGHPVLGTGNRGAIYRVESPNLWTQLAKATSSQVTVLVPGPAGAIYGAASNVGKILRIGPEYEESGTIESSVFDAGTFTYWGRLNADVADNGGTVSFETRSGNVDRPHSSWSAWEPLQNGRAMSPSARFLQWRASLRGGPKGTPEIIGTDVAWMAKNLAPVVEVVESTPLNYRFPQPSSSPIATPKTMTLPALGKKSTSSSTLDSSSSAATLTYAKGMAGVRWAANDPNGDSLEYRVEIRGANEKTWKPLKDRVRDRFLTFDTTAFPDGDYVLRVIATDALDNARGDALTSEISSPVFLIDNSPPRIEALSAQQTSAGKIQLRFQATDDSAWIARAEYSVNGIDWLLIEPASRLSDSKALDYDLTFDRPQPGELSIAVRVLDEFDNQAVAKIVVR